MNPPARTDPNLSGLLRSATMLAGPRLSRYPGQGNAQKTRGAVRTPSWLVSCPNYARMGLGSMVTRLRPLGRQQNALPCPPPAADPRHRRPHRWQEGSLDQGTNAMRIYAPDRPDDPVGARGRAGPGTPTHLLRPHPPP